MGQRTNGGILGVANTPTTSSASGVWTLDEVAVFKKAGLWPAAATFDLSVDSASVNKGGSFTVTLTTTGVANGTLVPYTITGIASADLSSGSLTGNFTVSSNTASLTFTTASSGGTSGNLTATVTCGGDTVTISFVEGDTYFKYVTALLHGDGTNAAQNNTFIDSSTNNFTITRNGDATQGTFTPFGDTWSTSLNGSGSCLSVASNAAFGFGTGDYTVEGWFYLNSLTTSGGISTNAFLWDMRNGSGSGVVGTLYLDNSTFVPYYQVAGTDIVTGASAFVANQWTHVAVSRVSGTTRMFINGVQSGSSYTDSNNYVTCPVVIGRENDTNQNRYLNGYVSNFRIVKGTGLYSSAFTPSTTPLTAISGTSLLTCQSNRFKDNSTNAFAITVTGSPSVQKFSPFSPTAAYSTSGLGGSAYFDGTGDWITTAGNSVYNMGSGDFTIEAWIYPQGSGNRRFVDYSNGTASNSNFSFVLRTTSSNTISGVVFIGSSDYVITSTETFSNTWVHVALVRNGTGSNNLKLYVNGVSVGTPQSIGSSSINTLTGTPYLSISSYYNGSGEIFNGYVNDVRITKGGALYTATFTPPTAPLTTTVSAGTVSLLSNFTNGGIYDNAMMNDWQTVGNAQLSTSVKKYGSASLAFDGTGDYLVVPSASKQNFVFGTGDFTIEFWAWKSSNGVNGYDGVIAADDNGSATYGFGVELSSSRGFVFYNQSTTRIQSNFNPNDSTWHHYAVVRSNGVMALYKDGVQLTTASYSGELFCSPTLRVGSIATTANFNGYIDDLRITKGYARYTSNFTAPTGAFQDR